MFRSDVVIELDNFKSHVDILLANRKNCLIRRKSLNLTHIYFVSELSIGTWV